MKCRVAAGPVSIGNLKVSGILTSDANIVFGNLIAAETTSPGQLIPCQAA